MYKIVRKAALELQVIDRNKTVKVAGILRKLKNVFKQLTDKEFSKDVDRIRNDSYDVQSVASHLNAKIDELLSAVKDGDVQSYENALEQVRELSLDLTKELKQLNQSAKSVKKEVRQSTEPSDRSYQTPEDSTGQPAEDYKGQGDGRYKNPESIRNVRNMIEKLKEDRPDHDVPIGKEHLGKPFNSFKWFDGSYFEVTDNSKNQLIEKFSIVISKSKNLDKNIIVEILNRNWDEFLNRIINSIKDGTIINYDIAKPGEIRRTIWEMQLNAQSKTFIVPELEIPISARFSITDMGLTKTDSKPLIIANVYNISFSKAAREAPPENVDRYRFAAPTTGQKSPPSAVAVNKQTSARLDSYKKALSENKILNPVEYEIKRISEMDLAEALIEGYKKVYGSQPSMEVLGSAWSQAVLERDPSLGLPNYNIGNITAGKSWVESGKPFFTRGTVEVDKNSKEYKVISKWRAYASAAEGAIGYWQLLGNKFKDAMAWMEAGDPVSASVALGEKGYYTANIAKYSSNVGKIYQQRFLKNIAPKLANDLKSNPAPPPGKKPAVMDKRDSLANAPKSKSNPDQESDSGMDNLLSALFAMGPVEKMVVKSILNTKLPTTETVISLSSLSAPFGIRLKFAKALSKTLKDVIDADVSIHTDNSKIEVQCSALGTEFAVNSAVQSLCDCVNVALFEKTKSMGHYSISYHLVSDTLSKYSEYKG